VERALSLFFGSRFYIKKAESKGLKEIIAFILSTLICWRWQFDALSIMLVQEKMTIYGEIITGAVIAGGSKASIKLFHDILDVKSSAEREREKTAQMISNQNMMKKLFLLLFAFFAAEVCFADYVVTNRKTSVKSAPSSQSAVVMQLEEGTSFACSIAGTKTNNYYKVQSPLFCWRCMDLQKHL